MACEKLQLQFFFFPAMAQGHMIPMVDMARLFASRGIKATIVTTPINAALISKSLERTTVNILTFKFPSAEVGLPEGCENVDTTPPHLLPNLFMASQKMQDPIDKILRDHRPDCLVADWFFPWATDVAGRYNIPRIEFNATSFFNVCVTHCMHLYKPFRNVSSDSEPFVIPNLPDVIQMTRLQFPYHVNRDEVTESDTQNGVRESSELKSYGSLFYSFNDLEPAYVDYFRKVLGRKGWSVGPLSLCFRNMEGRTHRGGEAAIDEHECLKWLDSQEPYSVIYICFGSLSNFNESQLREIAFALEACGHQFVWVVRKSMQKKDDQEEHEEDWLPEGFEKRTKGKGLIIRGWAPQVVILEHKAVGAFLTHCGWNSVLEGVAVGVPMVTWPVFADHFCNEQLVTQVLRIGVPVGVKKWVTLIGDSVKREAIEKAVKRIMAGEDAEKMRARAKALAEKAKHAVEEGGSSMVDLEALIQEIASRRVAVDACKLPVQFSS
uniref:Glycosyltransferase n=1 Tax=Polygala tenuifolia TaxID=355332 RepID=A0A4P2X653_9FABA|nr:UDP-glycosyltransferase [Polygala tenuifolia]